ncbi:MAG: formyltetrahydrofolate deformylase [Anaerolineae bacterium]|nr:formyltetrahydrofolate deformylase [Anaerolineae bacterium]
MQNFAVLMLNCPDQKGIVAVVTEFISRNGGNILSLEQHVDPQANEFFMRVQWDLTDFVIPKEKISDYFGTLIGARLHMRWQLYFANERLRMALFVSKPAHCLYDILGRWHAGEWKIDIPFIVSNHLDHQEVAQRFGIPFHHFSMNAENRQDQEQKQIALLQQHHIDFVVLARYMMIIGRPFVEAFSGRIINIHHAFLPAFIGAKPYHRAYERGVKLVGATAHYVTEALDEGPIIEQDVVRVSHRDSVEELTRRGGDVEKLVLSRAIRRHIERKTLVFQNRVMVFE